MSFLGIYWMIGATSAWVRVGRNGYGLHVKHRSDGAYFSERYGYKRYWPGWDRNPRWRVGLLRPWRDNSRSA